jgi:hypothetical protein
MSEVVDAVRARRSTGTKKVNYAKEQQFSDEDNIFEDSPDEEPVAPRRKSTSSKPRKSTSGKSVAVATSTAVQYAEEDDDDDLYQSNKPVYTEKGYDWTLLPIRERFPFLPEYEEDGSPKIDLIVGRRPVDEKEDGADDDEKEEEVDEEEEEETGRKTRKPKGSPKNSKASPTKNESTTGPVDYEYLVKYKGRSYLHLEWKSGADLESMNKSAKGIYRRYLKKVMAGIEEDIENPDFDPSYVVPEKVIDEGDQEITVELTDKELLRWEKQREKELAEDDDENEDKTVADAPVTKEEKMEEQDEKKEDESKGK